MSDQDSPTDSVPQRNALWAMRCDARHRAMVSYRYHLMGHVPMPGWHKRALSDFCA